MSNTIPVVSVCMLTYMHGSYLAESIEGVLMQNVDFGVELIIADDCSPDNTKDIVYSFQNNHPNGYWIKYLRHNENVGMMKNFILCLKECKGNFIAFCDGDDYWADRFKLKNQVGKFNFYPELNLYSHKKKYFYQENGRIKTDNVQPKKSGFFSVRDLAIGKIEVSTSTVMIRNVIGPDFYNYITLFSVGDFPLWLYVLNQGIGFFSVDELAIYRVHSGGVFNSRSDFERCLLHFKLYALCKKQFKGVVFDALDLSTIKTAQKLYSFVNKEISKTDFEKLLLENNCDLEEFYRGFDKTSNNFTNLFKIKLQDFFRNLKRLND